MKKIELKSLYIQNVAFCKREIFLNVLEYQIGSEFVIALFDLLYNLRKNIWGYKKSGILYFPSHQSKSEEININFKFYQPGDAPAALTLRPDSFEPDEASAFQDLPPATQRLGWLSEPAYLNF